MELINIYFEIIIFFNYFFCKLKYLEIMLVCIFKLKVVNKYLIVIKMFGLECLNKFVVILKV